MNLTTGRLPGRIRVVERFVRRIRATQLGDTENAVNTFKKATAMVAGTAALVMAGAGAASANAEGDSAAVESPGVVSGNNIVVPIHIPINLCGNSINIIGFINPTWGNVCLNLDGDEHHETAAGHHSEGGAELHG
jgi:small secreted domain DUF320